MTEELNDNKLELLDDIETIHHSLGFMGDNDMRMSDKGAIELIGHEGIALTKYKDSVGVWTIGVGLTRTEIPDIASWPMDKKLSMSEAIEMFHKALGKYEGALNKAIKVKIPQHQFDALVSWCYNVGTGYVRGTDKIRVATVIRDINAGASPSKLAADLMMFRKPPEITGRRKKEALLIEKGIYSNKGKALLFPAIKGKPVYSKATEIDLREYLWENLI